MLTVMRRQALHAEISFVCRSHRASTTSPGSVTIHEGEWAYCRGALPAAAPGHSWQRIIPTTVEEVRIRGGKPAE
jgi:hypothetical protein